VERRDKAPPLRLNGAAGEVHAARLPVNPKSYLSEARVIGDPGPTDAGSFVQQLATPRFPEKGEAEEAGFNLRSALRRLHREALEGKGADRPQDEGHQHLPKSLFENSVWSPAFRRRGAETA
jgi:hypothetical protein